MDYDCKQELRCQPRSIPVAYGNDLGYAEDVAFVFTCMARVSVFGNE